MTEITNTSSNPEHIAIIMDGNGRWAEKKGLNRIQGHNVGAKRVKEIVQASVDLKIKYLTLYAFSMENWKRPKIEILGLMKLLVSFLHKNLAIMKKNKIRLNVIGRINMLPEKTRKVLLRTLNTTAENSNMILTLALSYGARAEIVDAVKKIAESAKAGDILCEDIDERLVAENLYTHDMPDPDLMIRTSGEVRISNFLLWQLSYSEMHFTDTLWPDFSEDEYVKIINDYNNRNRRFGGIKNA